MERSLPTGSELLSLPRVNEKNGAVEDLGFLHMGARGLIELRGGEAEPLMRPFVELDGAEAGLSDFEWERLGFWYPRFEARSGGLRIEGVILAPVGERGFGYRLRFENTGPAAEFRFGLRGLAGSAWHCVNVDKRIEGSLRCFVSGWSGLPVFEQMCGVPLFALAPICEPEAEAEFAPAAEGRAWRLSRAACLAPGQLAELTVWWGLGPFCRRGAHEAVQYESVFLHLLFHGQDAGHGGAGPCHQPFAALLRQRRILGQGQPALELPRRARRRPRPRA